MYVCNCQGVRQSELSELIRSGVGSVRALRDRLGVGSGCGKCLCDVRQQLRDEIELRRRDDVECQGCGKCRMDHGGAVEADAPLHSTPSGLPYAAQSRSPVEVRSAC